MKKYFPDKWAKGTQCDKKYFFNVWNTIFPQQVKQVMDHANSQRYTVKGEEVKNNSIMLTERWENELKEMPFFSKEKGRMSHLLKLKSKIGGRKCKIYVKHIRGLKPPTIEMRRG